MNQYAVIDRLLYEEKYIPVVFSEGRIIHFPEFDILEQALQSLKEKYPEAHVFQVNGKTREDYDEAYDQFIHAWEKEGYIYPDQHHTELQCECGGELRLDRPGGGGAYGVLYHDWYSCFKCARIYSCAIQDRQFGVSREWKYEDLGEKQFKECDPPQGLPVVNPWGYREDRLVLRESFRKEEE